MKDIKQAEELIVPIYYLELMPNRDMTIDYNT